MYRTNIYLDEEQVRALRHLAVEERCSLSELVRRAIDSYISQRLGNETIWRERLDEFVDRVRTRMAKQVPSPATEADISEARKEVRQAHRAASRR